MQNGDFQVTPKCRGSDPQKPFLRQPWLLRQGRRGEPPPLVVVPVPLGTRIAQWHPLLATKAINRLAHGPFFGRRGFRTRRLQSALMGPIFNTEPGRQKIRTGLTETGVLGTLLKGYQFIRKTATEDSQGRVEHKSYLKVLVSISQNGRFSAFSQGVWKSGL